MFLNYLQEQKRSHPALQVDGDSERFVADRQHPTVPHFSMKSQAVTESCIKTQYSTSKDNSLIRSTKP